MDKIDDLFELVLEQIDDEERRNQFKLEYGIAKVESQLIGLESQLNGVTSRLIDIECLLKITNDKLDKLEKKYGEEETVNLFVDGELIAKSCVEDNG